VGIKIDVHFSFAIFSILAIKNGTACEPPQTN
jgi:hypothetical protein